MSIFNLTFENSAFASSDFPTNNNFYLNSEVSECIRYKIQYGKTVAITEKNMYVYLEFWELGKTSISVM